MPTETIKIVIAKNGSVKIEGVGFAGVGCVQATKFLEEKLGAVAGRELKPEYNQEPDLQARQEQGT